MTRRFWIGLALAVPVFLLAMGGHVPGSACTVCSVPRRRRWVQLVLATPVVLWAGLAVLRARLGVGRAAAASTCSR